MDFFISEIDIAGPPFLNLERSTVEVYEKVRTKNLGYNKYGRARTYYFLPTFNRWSR